MVTEMGRRNVQGGDSGGPVFSLASHNRVTAKGIISGSGENLMVFQDFGTASRDFGINVLTN